MKRFFSSFTPNNFPVSLFIYFTPSYVDAYTFICTKQKMTIFKHYLPKDCFGNIQTRPWIDCNWTRTQNHLVLKRTLDHLAKLAKWLSCVLSAYLYGAFDCVLVISRTRAVQLFLINFFKCVDDVFSSHSFILIKWTWGYFAQICMINQKLFF